MWKIIREWVVFRLSDPHAKSIWLYMLFYEMVSLTWCRYRCWIHWLHRTRFAYCYTQWNSNGCQCTYGNYYAQSNPDSFIFWCNSTMTVKYSYIVWKIKHHIRFCRCWTHFNEHFARRLWKFICRFSTLKMCSRANISNLTNDKTTYFIAVFNGYTIVPNWHL